MIRKPGSDKGPGFSMFGAYVCGLIEGYVKLRFTHADIEVYARGIEEMCIRDSFESGIIKRRGRITAKNTVSDYFPVEQEYGLSLIHI